MARSDVTIADLSSPPRKGLVRLWPTNLAHIDGVPSLPIDVAPAVAAELLAYFPAAFTADPPPREKE